MTELNIKEFRFNAVNPTVTHTGMNRINIPKKSSYLNAHILIELPEEYLSLYEDTPWAICEKLDNDPGIVVNFDCNIQHNHITQAAYSFVQDNYESPSLIDDIFKVMETLYTWKI